MKILNLNTPEGISFFQRIVTAYSNQCLVESSTARAICLLYLHPIADWQSLGFTPNEIASRIQAEEHKINNILGK